MFQKFFCCCNGLVEFCLVSLYCFFFCEEYFNACICTNCLKFVLCNSSNGFSIYKYFFYFKSFIWLDCKYLIFSFFYFHCTAWINGSTAMCNCCDRKFFLYRWFFLQFFNCISYSCHSCFNLCLARIRIIKYILRKIYCVFQRFYRFFCVSICSRKFLSRICKNCFQGCLICFWYSRFFCQTFCCFFYCFCSCTYTFLCCVFICCYFFCFCYCIFQRFHGLFCILVLFFQRFFGCIDCCFQCIFVHYNWRFFFYQSNVKFIKLWRILFRCCKYQCSITCFIYYKLDILCVCCFCLISSSYFHNFCLSRNFIISLRPSQSIICITATELYSCFIFPRFFCMIV